MVFMMFKMLIISLAATIVAAFVVPVALLHQSQFATFAAVEVVLLVECVVLIPLLKVAFERFDPSSTQVC